MHIDVNGTRLWFDVDGLALVPDGPTMRQRPTVILVHGGPGGYDHSYFKPWFAPLADVAPRCLSRPARARPLGPTRPGRLDVPALCRRHRRVLRGAGVERPIVLGHSMGGFIALEYGIRHAAKPGA